MGVDRAWYLGANKMPVTNDITQANPVVDADFDTWGVKQNTFFDQVRSTVGQLVTAVNGLLTDIVGRVAKAGDTLTGDLVLADVGPTNALSVGFRGLPVISIDADRTFFLTDASKMIRLTGSTARTWTIPPAGSVGFPVGTVIVLRSFSTANLNLVRGSGVQLRIDGISSDGNRVIIPFGKVALVHEDTNIWTVAGAGVS